MIPLFAKSAVIFTIAAVTAAALAPVVFKLDARMAAQVKARKTGKAMHPDLATPRDVMAGRRAA